MILERRRKGFEILDEDEKNSRLRGFEIGKGEEGVKDLVAISPPGDDRGRLPLHLGRESKTCPSCFKAQEFDG